MPRKDITSFNVSGNLKTAFESAGFTDEIRPESGRGFYNGAANNRILCLEQPANIPGLRTVEINNATVADTDYIGTDTKQVDAMAKALRAYLQANAQQLRQG